MGSVHAPTLIQTHTEHIGLVELLTICEKALLSEQARKPHSIGNTAVPGSCWIWIVAQLTSHIQASLSNAINMHIY